MEGELYDREFYRELYRTIMAVGAGFRHAKVQFSDGLILAVFLFGVYRERPVHWACRTTDWDREFAWVPRPSPATMSRRLRSVLVWLLCSAVLLALRERQPQSLLRTADAKPLGVSGYSHDRDAAWGWATKGKARGYKVFLLRDGWAVDAWRLGPMNASDSEMAQALVTACPREGYLLGDSGYDSNPLHAVCATYGIQLLAPRKKEDAQGLGHRPHEAGRLRSLHLLTTPFGQDLYALRTAHERFLGTWCSFGGGLTALPAWVRRPHRVAPWVAAKLLIYAVRLDLVTHRVRLWQQLNLQRR